MQQLIPYALRMIDGQDQLTVNGRDLYSFLSIGKDYANWIRAQIKRAHLLANIDYIVFAQMGENPQGGRPSNEYHFTFDAAKHICMRSSTEKGHAVRTYFLACEKQWQQAQHGTSNDALLERYPELKAIALAREEARLAHEKAEEARVQAAKAEAKADMALAEHSRMTIEEFVTRNGLMHQIPPHTWSQAARWVGEFCGHWQLDCKKRPTPWQRWPDEWEYHVSALMAYTRQAERQAGQIALVPRQERADA